MTRGDELDEAVVRDIVVRANEGQVGRFVVCVKTLNNLEGPSVTVRTLVWKQRAHASPECITTREQTRATLSSSTNQPEALYTRLSPSAQVFSVDRVEMREAKNERSMF